jgi:hypothetical protein
MRYAKRGGRKLTRRAYKPGYVNFLDNKLIVRSGPFSNFGWGHGLNSWGTTYSGANVRASRYGYSGHQLGFFSRLFYGY